jgi:polysaccharide biosynthesis/export protein ExoF
MSLTSKQKGRPRTPQRTPAQGSMLLLGFAAAGVFGAAALETSSHANRIADGLSKFERHWQATFPKGMTSATALVGIEPPAAVKHTKIAAAGDLPLAVVATATEEAAVALPEKDSADAASALASGASHGVSGSTFEIGDKLKIAFYEQVDLQDDRWAKARPMRSALQQRTELTGEYVIQPDGSISLPLFGLISLAGRSAFEIQNDLEARLHELTGRKGFVTAVVVERQPIYVLGPVKNPGSFKYAPGMTVFHAIALAGGLDRGSQGAWQDIEGIRATEKQQSSIEHLIHLIARDAVLRAERDGAPLKLPARLLELAGEASAKNALNLEIDRREVAVLSNRARASTYAVAIENAKQEIETLSSRVPVVDANVKLRDDRVNRMRALASRNVVDNVVVDQAQADLLSIQERRQETLGNIMAAKQRLSMAEQEKIRHQSEVRSELEQSIERVEREAADAERDLASTDGVIRAVKLSGPRVTAASAEDSLAYEIVRHTPSGTVVLNSTGTDSLEPGDLVRLRSPHEVDQRAPNTMRANRASTGE